MWIGNTCGLKLIHVSYFGGTAPYQYSMSPRKSEYHARADECIQRAAEIDDPEAKESWLKLERSWRRLADEDDGIIISE